MSGLFLRHSCGWPVQQGCACCSFRADAADPPAPQAGAIWKAFEQRGEKSASTQEQRPSSTRAQTARRLPRLPVTKLQQRTGGVACRDNPYTAVVAHRSSQRGRTSSAACKTKNASKGEHLPSPSYRTRAGSKMLKCSRGVSHQKQKQTLRFSSSSDLPLPCFAARGFSSPRETSICRPYSLRASCWPWCACVQQRCCKPTYILS